MRVAVRRVLLNYADGLGNSLQMPLQWRVSRLEHVVLTVAEGTVTFDDLVWYFKAVEEVGALPYQKIFVAHSAMLDLSKSEVRQLADRLVSMNNAFPLGAVAIVGAPARSLEFQRFFDAIATVRRPLHLARTIHDARRWLKHQRERPRRSAAFVIRALPLRQS
jgi:hypothetical protein